MKLSVVGLGPGEPAFLTVGALDALRAVSGVAILGAPAELRGHLRDNGVPLERDWIADEGAFASGAPAAVAAFVATIESVLSPALAVLGHPLADFTALPVVVRELEARGHSAFVIPGMPRATLSASLSMPLVPLPSPSQHYSWDDLIEIMARLRAGCPWDREQTHRSLVPYLIEETYEVVEAIENADNEGLCEELGDLLLQIVFHAQLGAETASFTVADVIDALANKMVRRHPHVFGDAEIRDVDAQWVNWEKLKALEATGKKRRSRLDGIPRALGALQRGQRMQEKAARVGFDWKNVEGVLDKLAEERRELAEARERSEPDQIREELGDVLFTLVNLARSMGVDAEAAMREANEKFYRRFRIMEEAAARQDRQLADMSIDELEALWQRAKTAESISPQES
ncbi:MAG TPA: nucleoside triphosphate pyrophosphohydrolase [Candidatus Tumulicola sp.]|jgi:tetrapyrrole methylase family protein/MazG family protein